MTTPTTQREADEREKFEAWLKGHDPRKFEPDAYWDHTYKWKAWQARAALAQSEAPAPNRQADDHAISQMVERARLATDLHCDGLAHEPSKEYSDAYFYRMLVRQAAPEAPASEQQENGVPLDTATLWSIYDVLIEAGNIKLAHKVNQSIPSTAATTASESDTCAKMRALCSACGGTGDVHGLDGEWRGICDCDASAWNVCTPAQQTERMQPHERQLVQPSRQAAPLGSAQLSALVDMYRKGAVLEDVFQRAAALARAPLPAQATAKECRKLGGTCGCAFGACANGLDQPAVAYAAPAQAADVARDAERLDKMIDWYLRGGQRSEIHSYGHVEHTTRGHVLAWLDGTLPEEGKP